MGYYEPEVDSEWELTSLEVRRQLDRIAAELDEDLHLAAAAKSKERTRVWRDWVQDNLQNGARGAHKWSHVPKAWRPEAVKRDRGATGAPQEILAVLADGLATIK